MKRAAGGASDGWDGRAGSALDCGALWELRRVVGERFKYGFCAVRAVREEEGNCFFQSCKAVVSGAGMAVDAVEKCCEVDEFVARIDELKVEDILLARHAGNLRRDLQKPIMKNCEIVMACVSLWDRVWWWRVGDLRA